MGPLVPRRGQQWRRDGVEERGGDADLGEGGGGRGAPGELAGSLLGGQGRGGGT